MAKLKIALIFIAMMSLVIPLSATKATGASKVFKLGVICPLTGWNARTGEEVKNATIKAFEDVGYKIGDYQIELVWIDCQSDPAKASNAYAEAVEMKGIQATFHTWHSSVAAALMDLAVHYKVPGIFPMGTAGAVNAKFDSNPEKYRGYWIKGYPPPAMNMVVYTDALTDAIKRGLWKPANKKVALYGEDSDWGRDVTEELNTLFLNKGWEVSFKDYLMMNQTEFYPLLNKYKNSGVTIVAGTISSPPGVSAFLKQAAEVDLKAVIISSGLSWIGEWYQLTGKASNYVLDQVARFITPEAKAFAKVMRERFAYEPGPTASGMTYELANFFIKKIAPSAIKQYGKLDKESLYKVMHDDVSTGKLTYGRKDGAILMEEWKYDPKTNAPVVDPDHFCEPIVQYMNGQGKIVYPPRWKEADMQFRR